MAPRRKSACPQVCPSGFGHLADQKWWNEVANLPQHLESVAALEWFGLFFHLLLVAQLQTHSNAFFQKSMGCY
jgi:hypothetical protein